MNAVWWRRFYNKSHVNDYGEFCWRSVWHWPQSVRIFGFKIQSIMNIHCLNHWSIIICLQLIVLFWLDCLCSVYINVWYSQTCKINFLCPTKSQFNFYICRIVNRIREVLYDFALSCDENGKLIVKQNYSNAPRRSFTTYSWSFVFDFIFLLQKTSFSIVVICFLSFVFSSL